MSKVRLGVRTQVEPRVDRACASRVSAVTGSSPRRSRMMMSRLTSSSSRCRRVEADHRASRRQRAGPTPSIVGPRVRWSRSTMRSATDRGRGRRSTHAGAELDVARPLGRRGDEDLRRGDDLAAGGVVLAYPGLVVAQAIQVLDELEVSLERERRVLAGRMERRQEDAEAIRRSLRPLVDLWDDTPVTDLVGKSDAAPSWCDERAGKGDGGGARRALVAVTGRDPARARRCDVGDGSRSTCAGGTASAPAP